jgi:hypothetical protein
MSIKDLFYMGYPAHEYELLPNGLLREARRCFNFQIKIAMMVSILAQLFTIYNDYLRDICKERKQSTPIIWCSLVHYMWFSSLCCRCFLLLECSFRFLADTLGRHLAILRKYCYRKFRRMQLLQMGDGRKPLIQ